MSSSPLSILFGAGLSCACAAGFLLTKRVRPFAFRWAGTFLFAAFLSLVAHFLQHRAETWTGLDLQTSAAGDAGEFVFLFAFVAPLSEVLKVAAAWPAFRSTCVRSAEDGMLFSAAAALGFSATPAASSFFPEAGPLVVCLRPLLGLPADVFFAGVWGYVLGQSAWPRTPTRRFSVAWLAAIVGHALYTYIVFARGEGAMLLAIPLLLVMAAVTWLAFRSVPSKSESPLSFEPSSSLLPSSGLRDLAALRAQLRHGPDPVRFRWVFIGALVSLGCLIACLLGTVAMANRLHVDFSMVDERHVSTMAPVVILTVGAMASFAVSGFFVARAGAGRTLFEPAAAAALSLFIVVVAFSAISASAAVLALVASPVAWIFSCAGAWVGLPRN